MRVSDLLGINIVDTIAPKITLYRTINKNRMKYSAPPDYMDEILYSKPADATFSASDCPYWDWYILSIDEVSSKDIKLYIGYEEP